MSVNTYAIERIIPPKDWLVVLLIAVAMLLLSGCGNKPRIAPAPPPPVVAKIAVPVDCEIEQVPMPAYPGEFVISGMDVYTLARLAMADRRVRIAERDRLRAANKNPCPAAPQGN